MPNVGIFSVGLGRANPDRLCTLLSSVRSPFKFRAAPRLATLGDPDIADYGYSDAVFERVIRPHRGAFDVYIVLTGVPIDGNFFTRTVGHHLIISTFYQTEDLLRESGRTPEQYAAMAVCQELVSMEFQRVTGQHWSDLFHQDPRGCVFDFAGIKSQKLAKLQSSAICEDCLGLLARSNVNNEVVDFSKALLRRIRRPSLKHALSLCMVAPGLSFAYGGLVIGTAVNLFSSLAMNSSPPTPAQRYTALGSVAAVLAVPILVYGWLLYKELQRRLA